MTVALSITALVFNDFVLPPPDLNGGWKYTEVTEDTTHPPYKGMRVTYKVLLTQEGLSVNGTGERISQQLPGKTIERFKPEVRVIVDVSGQISRKFFSRDELVLRIHVKNRPPVRLATSLHEVQHFSESMMSGCFKTTAASASGPTEWRRIGWSSKDDVMPLETSGSCSGR